jgi:hypothetical protein
VNKRKKARRPGGKLKPGRRAEPQQAVVSVPRDVHYICQECGADFWSIAVPASCPRDANHHYIQWENYEYWNREHPLIYDSDGVIIRRKGT